MKTCCVDSADKCPNSSCTMILRSACSHKHSHKSLTSSEAQSQQNSTPKRRPLKNSSTISDYETYLPKKSFNTALQSPIENFSLTSKSLSFSEEELVYNHLAFLQNDSYVADHNGQRFDFVRKKLDLIETPSYIRQYEESEIIDNALNLEKESYYSNLSAMSRTRRVDTTRRRNSARLQSGSESEEETSLRGSSNNHLNHQSSTYLHLNSPVASPTISSTRSSSRLSVNSTMTRNSMPPYVPPPDSHTSTTNTNLYNNTPTGNSVYNQIGDSVYNQRLPSPIESNFDRFRWVLWRYVYLKIITCISFDVWLLSRMRKNRKVMVILLTLPLLMYLLYGLSQTEFKESFHAINSSLSAFLSSCFSLLFSIHRSSEQFMNSEESGHKCEGISHAFSTLSTIPSFFSSLFVTKEATSSVCVTPSYSKDSKAIKSSAATDSLSTGEIKSHVIEALEKHIQSHTQEIQALRAMGKQLENDIRMLKEPLKDISSGQKTILNSLNAKLNTFEEKLSVLASPKQDYAKDFNSPEFVSSIERHFITALKNVMGGDKNAKSYVFFNDWLHAKMSDEIHIAIEKSKKDKPSERKLDQSDLDMVKSIVEHHLESLKTDWSSYARATGTPTYDGELSELNMRRIVKEALLLYDADKTGKVDYALESGGGSVLGTRCSESYVEKTGKFSIFGLPLWSDVNTPRTAIQPDVQPGKCWAFKGSQGFLVIQLSYTILPTGFTMEHIPVSLSPTGSIDGAPKDFSVWGLSSESDSEGTLLGKFSYDINGDPLQYFPIKKIKTATYAFVELKIHSNHGNMEYTCLYRFRVHGKRIK